MNLDVPLDELIKSKSNKRSGSATATKGRANTKQVKVNNGGTIRSSRQSTPTGNSKGAIATSLTPRGGTTAANNVTNDPFSVPLDTLIASKSRQAAQNAQATGNKKRASQQGGRASLAGSRLRGRRYFSGAAAASARPSAQNADSPAVVRVSNKVNVKRGVQQKLKSSYSKGLAAHANRSNRSILAVSASAGSGGGGTRNLSINRRGVNGRNVATRGGGSGMTPSSFSRQRRQQNDNTRWNQPRGSRSIAFSQNGRGSTRGGVHRVGGGGLHSAAPTSRSMISHAIGDTLSYNTGLGGPGGVAAAAIYRHTDMGSSASNCHVAPPLYDKAVVTGSGGLQGMENQESSNAVFSESDRSMFSKIKIMAQLDKITLPNAASTAVQDSVNQRHYSNHPASTMGGANAAANVGVPRYRTLSDRFLS